MNKIQFENLLAKYPQDLKEKINQIRFGQNLQKIGILNDNFQNLQSCINDVELEFFMPDQIIQYRGSFADKIYLVLKGSVKLLQENLGERSVVHTYKEGEYFGQEQFFTDKASMYDIKSSDFSTLLSISRSQFIENILQDQGQNDFEKFKMISHQFQIGGKSDFVIKQCKICSQQYHNEEECKFVFYNPNQELTILKDIYSVPIKERGQIKRRKKKFLNHTLNLENIQNLQESIFNLIFSRKMRKYIKNLSDMLQDYEDRNKDAYYEAQRFLQEQQEEMEEKKLLENENYSQMSYIEQQDCSLEYNQRIETLQSQKIQSDNSLIKEGNQENQKGIQNQRVDKSLDLIKIQLVLKMRRCKKQMTGELKHSNLMKSLVKIQMDEDSNNKLSQENSLLHEDSIELQLNDAEPSIQDIQQIKNNDNFQALGMNIKNNQQNYLLSQSQQQILSEIPKIHLQQQQFQEEFRSSLKYYQKNINQQIQCQNSAIQRTIIEVDRQQYKNIQNLLQDFINNEKENKGMDFSGRSQVNYQNNLGQKKNNSSRFAFQRASQQNDVNSQNNYQNNYNNNILKNQDFNQNKSINFQQNLGKNQEMKRNGNQKRVTQLRNSQDMIFSNQNRQKENLNIDRFQSQNQEKKTNQNRNQSQIKNKNGETLTYGIDLNQLPAQELFKIFQSQPNMSQSRFINLLNQLQNNQFLEEEQHDGDNIFCSCKDCKEKDEFFWEFESLNKFETFFPENNWNYVKIKFFRHEHEKELYIKQLRKTSISAQNKSIEPNYKLFSKNKKNLRGIGDFKIGFGAQIMNKYQNQNQPKFKNKKVKGNKNILMKTKAKE
ncbi:Cyclic nucleotide-binding protein [Pseudocohnilembus persalinus]|uniref:Cyclic nucleotide-binding protein n=1 Tax=Pseudocohnilembus persalinus TaxID=266149 RepID=A0A0V0QR26_PSEPJ|nr:Cyclic nucleotide-binding protein [Pseudocohnilembus persalinus]|eukprot:KRX04708.1 Cyclic nucleotide-binding protein [Pseudocohnilembus persalinus]